MNYQKSSCNGLLHIDILSQEKSYLDFVEKKLLLFESIKAPENSLKIRIELITGTLPLLKLGDQHLIVNNTIIDIQQRTIKSWIPEKTPQFLNLNHMLIQPLGALLQALKFQTIHGALVCNDTQLIAFLGPGGSGKSTSSCILSLGGYTLLCDDLFFVSKTNDVYQFAPLRTNIKISNKDKKESFRDSKLETLSMSNLAFGREIVFVFPRYQKLQKELDVRLVSRKVAFKNLLADNLAMETGQQDCKKGRVEIFDFFYHLVQDIPLFEFSYNDQNIMQLNTKLEKALRQKKSHAV